MPHPWITVTASFPKGGMFPHVRIPGLHPTPRKSPKGERESVEVPAFPSHWQDWAPLLCSGGESYHRTMGGKSEAQAECPTWPPLLPCVGPG